MELLIVLTGLMRSLTDVVVRLTLLSLACLPAPFLFRKYSLGVSYRLPGKPLPVYIW
jgi:hypothetical protein